MTRTPSQSSPPPARAAVPPAAPAGRGGVTVTDRELSLRLGRPRTAPGHAPTEPGDGCQDLQSPAAMTISIAASGPGRAGGPSCEGPPGAGPGPGPGPRRRPGAIESCPSHDHNLKFELQVQVHWPGNFKLVARASGHWARASSESPRHRRRAAGRPRGGNLSPAAASRVLAAARRGGTQI